MTKYYMKEIPELPVYVHGTPIKFDILETSDQVLIEELDKCIARGVGGVMSITAEVFAEELKKKELGNSSLFSSQPLHKRQELSALHSLKAPVAGDEKRFDFGGTFAKHQEREHTPHNMAGLPSSFNGPSNPGPKTMPDPIELPALSEFKTTKPTTAKLSEVMAQ